MRAVRVRKRGKGRDHLFSVHWLREADEAKTICGLTVAKLNEAELVDLETLPSSERCLSCDEGVAHYTSDKRSRSANGVTLQPSLGYFSRQHGRGSRILK